MRQKHGYHQRQLRKHFEQRSLKLELRNLLEELELVINMPFDELDADRQSSHRNVRELCTLFLNQRILCRYNFEFLPKVIDSMKDMRAFLDVLLLLLDVLHG